MIGLHVLEPGFSVYSQHQSAIGERVLSYDHTYLARLGVPNALLDKAGEGLCSLPLEERRIVYNHLFNSATLRAQFNKIVRSFGFSDETRDELWAAGFALLFEKNASYISYKYLFGDEGKNNGVFKGLMVAEKRTRNKVAERTLSLDQPFAAEGGVTLGDSLVAEVQRSTLEDSDFLDFSGRGQSASLPAPFRRPRCILASIRMDLCGAVDTEGTSRQAFVHCKHGFESATSTSQNTFDMACMEVSRVTRA